MAEKTSRLGRTAAAVEKACYGMRRRTVSLSDGRAISVRLEGAFWEALELLADRQGTTVDSLVADVSAGLNDPSLPAALRMYAIDSLRRQTN